MNLPYKNINFDDSRLVEYEENEQLKKGELFTTFSQDEFEYYSIDSEHNRELKYINTNLFALLSKRIADIIAGEEVKLTTQDEKVQQWLDNWVERHNFNSLLYTAFEQSSALGDVVFKLSVGETYPGSGVYDIYCDMVSPKIWFPIYDNYNPNRTAYGHNFVFTKELRNGIAYLIETNIPGKIEYRAYIKTKGSKDIVAVNALEYFEDELANIDLIEVIDDETEVITYYQETGIDKCLVFHIKNSLDPESYFGTSDYEEIKSLVFNINLRLTANQSALNKYGDPLLFIPEGTISKVVDKLKNTGFSAGGGVGKNPLSDVTVDSNVAQSRQRASLVKEVLEEVRLVEAGGETQKPEFIQYNANLGDSFKQLELLYNAFYMSSELAPVLVDTHKTGAISGTALRILAQPTLKKAQRKITLARPVLTALLNTVLELANIVDGLVEEYPGIEDKVRIVFNDGLIDDDETLVRTEKMAIEGGFQTIEGAIQNREGGSPSEVQEKLDKLSE